MYCENPIKYNSNIKRAFVSVEITPQTTYLNHTHSDPSENVIDNNYFCRINEKFMGEKLTAQID